LREVKGMYFNPISSWWVKDLVCVKCGTTKSVKYEMNGKTYCNVCVLPESLMPDESTAYGNDCLGGKCEW